VEEPLSAQQAKVLIRAILREGNVRFSGHARRRMDERDMSEVDCANVLRGGDVVLVEPENGTWRYRVATPRMWVAVAFRSARTLVVVTVCRT